MEGSDFIAAWQAALGTQDWTRVEPMGHPDACVTFSNGAAHRGREAVQAAFTRNFTLIKSEHYAMADVHWVHAGADIAVYLFEYTWKGVINGQPAGGAGRGTHVLQKSGGAWQLLAEHLGPKA